MAAVSVKKKKSFARSSKPVIRMCVVDHKEHMSMTSSDTVWPIPMRAIGAQNLLTMPGGVSTSGYLHKKGGSQFSLMKWPLRFIIIHKGCVYYFKSSTSASPQGAFSLNGYNRVMRAAEETTSSNVFPFKIVHFSKKHRTWLFSAASEEERRSWMKHLRREIDHYNDRRESQSPSDTDSDTDSFYGSIEKPMDIRHPVDNADDDYMEEDDDDDEEDYLKPDSSPILTGRPTGPPPSYPPPPVPASSSKPLLNSKPPPIPPPIHRIPTNNLSKKLPLPSIPPLPAHKGPPSPSIPSHKGPPPPSIPAHKASPTSNIPSHKSLPPSIPVQKGPPPPSVPQIPFQKVPPPDPPFPSYLQRHDTPSPVTPPLPPPNPRRTVPKPVTGESRERPICEQLESRLRLNRPAQSSAHSHTHNHSPTHTLSHSPAHSPTHTLSHSPAHSPTHTLSQSPAHSPNNTIAHNSAHNTSLGNNFKVHPPTRPELAQIGLKPKPPPPTCKPPMPTSKKPASNNPHGRASPEGQSFRSPVDELPADLRSRWNSVKQEDNSDNDDYENVQLPDSVYIDTTETSFVEKLFRESGDCPDGLYAIRNSGTKTSKVLVVWDISIKRARNYRLFEENGCIFVDRELTFPSLAILIEHYYTHSLPQHGSLCLQRPFTKIL